MDSDADGVLLEAMRDPLISVAGVQVLGVRAPYVPSIVTKKKLGGTVLPGDTPAGKGPKYVVNVPGSMDDILSKCPTDEEIASIWRDFKFTFDSKPAPLKCITEGSNVMLTLINAFRCMKALTFDVPIPLIGTTNIYSWLKANGLVNIHVYDPGKTASDSGVVGFNLRYEAVAGAWTRSWDNGLGSGIKGLIALMIHEGAHHTLPLIASQHDCSGAADQLNPGWRFDMTGEYGAGTMHSPDGAVVYRSEVVGHASHGPVFKLVAADGHEMLKDDPILKTIPEVFGNDSSLEHGGAFAVQYWFDKWLEHNSGTQLSDAQKMAAGRSAADLLLSGRLSCGRPTKAAAPAVAPDAPQTVFLMEVPKQSPVALHRANAINPKIDAADLKTAPFHVLNFHFRG